MTGKNDVPVGYEGITASTGIITGISSAFHSTWQKPRHYNDTIDWSDKNCKIMDSSDVLPVPGQLEAQLGKCKTVRKSTFYKSREKTPQVRFLNDDEDDEVFGLHVNVRAHQFTNLLTICCC
jgi:hypothetical protein